jgi:hypothetical protein
MPMITELKAHRFFFLLVAKPEDHKSLFEDFKGLHRGAGLEKLLVAQPKGKHFLYEWVNQIALGADSKSPSVNFVQLHIYDAKGELSYRCSCVTDIALDKENVQKVVRAASISQRRCSC